MGIAESFEKRLEQFVEGFFARTFRSGLQPVELGRRLAREMVNGKTVTPSGVVVANHYRVLLSSQDRERFRHFEDSLVGELVHGLHEESRREGWRTLGPLQVEFVTDASLKLGRFVIETRIAEAPGGSGGAGGARLEVADGLVVALGADPVLIGRLPECQVRIDDPNMSRRHAEVLGANGGYAVRDLGSTNGTLVNGRRIAGDMPLRDGDVIAVGHSTMVFRS